MNNPGHQLLYSIRNRFLSRGCLWCGEMDLSRLECHHVRPREKDMSISDLIYFGISGLELMAELRKCEVLCAACHDVLHGHMPRPNSKKYH